MHGRRRLQRWHVRQRSDRRVLRVLAVSLLDAGMALEARAVLERLSQAHPDDPRLPELLRRLEETARGDE